MIWLLGIFLDTINPVLSSLISNLELFVIEWLFQETFQGHSYKVSGALFEYVDRKMRYI